MQYLAHTITFHNAANEHLGGLCIMNVDQSQCTLPLTNSLSVYMYVVSL